MKVIIVEDEFLAQQELSWLVKEHSQMEIVGTFDDGLDVLKFLQQHRVDAIFLDINIPSLDAAGAKHQPVCRINRLLCSSPRGKNMR
ncbi:response regulator [Escherichia coli]